MDSCWSLTGLNWRPVGRSGYKLFSQVYIPCKVEGSSVSVATLTRRGRTNRAMACGVIPPGLQGLLSDFDVQTEVLGGSSASPVLWNLLLGDLHMEVDGIRATILKGGFLQAHDLGHTTRPVPPIEMTAQQVYIQFPNLQSLKSTKELLLTRLFLHPYQEQTQRSELVLCMSKDSLIIPRHLGNPEVMVHLFAGGYGGWTSALRYYQPKIYPNVRTISVELDRKLSLSACTQPQRIVFSVRCETATWFVGKASR